MSNGPIYRPLMYILNYTPIIFKSSPLYEKTLVIIVLGLKMPTTPQILLHYNPIALVHFITLNQIPRNIMNMIFADG